MLAGGLTLLTLGVAGGLKSDLSVAKAMACGACAETSGRAASEASRA